MKEFVHATRYKAKELYGRFRSFACDCRRSVVCPPILTVIIGGILGLIVGAVIAFHPELFTGIR